MYKYIYPQNYWTNEKPITTKSLTTFNKRNFQDNYSVLGSCNL